MKTRLSKSSIGASEIQSVVEVLKKGYLGMGEEVSKLEQELASYLGGTASVVCVSSGTAALQLALEAYDVGEGDEVIVPSFTYVATFQAISATGATPVPVDVEYDSGFISLTEVQARMNKKTKAIMPVHYASSCRNIEQFYDLSEATGIPIVEDAAHSFGGMCGQRKIGSFGETICFSFDGIKNITCGEGGAVVTANSAVAQRVKDARLLGVEKDTEQRYSGSRSWDFDVSRQGWRYHMSNINAAIGRAQLHRINEFTQQRQLLAKVYVDELKDEKKINLFIDNLEGICPHIFPIKIDASLRSKVETDLDHEEVEFGYHYKPNHLLSYFKDLSQSFSVSELLWDEVITLPLHYDLKRSDVERICKIVKESINGD